MSNYQHVLNDLNTFIFDYDGVLSNGTVILMSDGDALRTANVKDGYALQLAVKLGYHVVIISGGYSPSMKKRFEALKITDVFLGVAHKEEVLMKYFKDKGTKPEHALYMGDDIPDHNAMIQVGLPCCPNDAVPEIKAVAKYISDRKGGEGCVRDVIEQTLKAQGKWMTDEGFKW